MRELMKQRTYRSFLLSFLCIFVLPMLLMLFFMDQTLNIARQEERTANRLLLEQYKNGVDAKMYSIKRIADTLIVDDKALLFSSAKDENEYLKSATVFQSIRMLMQQVATLSAANEYIDLVYLYFPSSEKVISNTAMDGPVFYERRVKNSFESYETFQSFMLSGHDGFSRLGTATQDDICFLRSFIRNDKPIITCAITLTDRFSDSFEALLNQKEGAGFTLLSPQGDVLYSTLNDASFLINGPEDGQTITVSDSRIIVLSSVSLGTQLKYVVTLPENLYTARLQTMQTLFGVLAGGILIVGVVLSFVLAQKRYAPIRKLREMVGDKPVQNARENHDDFTYLTEMVDAMRNEKTNISQRLQSTYKRMGNYQLEKLLIGSYQSTAAMEEELLFSDIAFSSDTFTLLAIRINKIEALDLSEETTLAHFVVINVLEELLAAFSPQIAQTDDLIVFILSLPDQDVRDELTHALRRGAEVLMTHFTIHLSAVLSRTVHGLYNLRVAYLEVKSELSQVMGKDCLLFSWQEKTEKCTLTNEIDALAHKLSRLISVGDWEEAQAQYDALKKANEGQPAWMVRMTLSLLIRECTEGLALRLKHEEMEPILCQSRHYVESPVGFDEFSDALPVLKAMAQAAPPLAGKAKADSVGQAAWNYINDNYALTDMSIQAVADHLGLTASYCSQLYKKQTGRGLMDDMNKVRLDKAKAHLLNTRQGVEEIAFAVGFLNSSTFIRTFKRYEGITPGQFRLSASGVNAKES